jgi:hypothetical protein
MQVQKKGDTRHSARKTKKNGLVSDMPWILSMHEHATCMQTALHELQSHRGMCHLIYNEVSGERGCLRLLPGHYQATSAACFLWSTSDASCRTTKVKQFVSPLATDHEVNSKTLMKLLLYLHYMI